MRGEMERRAIINWAQRLWRVFNIDIETCRACGVAVKVIASIEDPMVIKNMLAHLREKAASEPAGSQFDRHTGNQLLNNLHGCDPEGSGIGSIGLTTGGCRTVEMERADFCDGEGIQQEFRNYTSRSPGSSPYPVSFSIPVSM